MSGFQVMLNETQTKELQRYIFELTNEAVQQAIHNAGTDKEFLNQKEMSSWVGVSSNTLRSYVDEGMPMIVIGGRNLYSKKEVSKFLLSRQK
ncbi:MULTISPECIES: helix-turn-helix domain-containing protein [Enterococcaceae]|uniref:Helix-turn-helix domain-containing protein n=1 Tax=Enterococcus malodoratus ATCC 43197 TaxID=1158601 RepID=R2P5E6_9ENTE|nr:MULTISPECIES: helix-turn-helix domain-containing protein [Enterococcaceae]EOH78408.1 hypothetical protein UAI_01717 [Enterococcus malodoratus ATCC 43197]EOT64504.1 hypothetical protein I585_03704 [Enterococcus malodoratus ATCC 43197]UDM73555.1 helix-turn-helix domain-containing protein [Vagococcus fluvialis]SPW92750.1 excisionase family DNA binding domain-containing protein [Enterococcus malodoratus]STC72844.1 excisionase family DNA binding domain-containing protein [Enterococcus malodoratu